MMTKKNEQIVNLLTHFPRVSHALRAATWLSRFAYPTVVDIFTYVTPIDSLVLTWSSLGSHGVHRVFWSGTEFRKLVGDTRYCYIKPQPHPHRNSSTTDELAAAFFYGGADHIAIIPLSTDNDEFIGCIRIVGPQAELRKIPFQHGDSGSAIGRTSSTLRQSDFRIAPVILGRWAAHSLVADHSTYATCLHTIAKCISGYFPKAHCVVWERDFDNAKMKFLSSTWKISTDILSGVTDSIEHPKYMFSIVAYSGRSAVLPNFPEDLAGFAHPNEDWTSDQIFKRLTEVLETTSVSYFAIPVKIDDVVVSVIALLCPRKSEHFGWAERFTSVCLGELARSFEKESLKKASRLIEKNIERLALRKTADFADTTVGILKDVCISIIPFGNITVSSIDVLDAERGILPKNNPEAHFIQNRARQLLELGSIQLVIASNGTPAPLAKGFLIMPVQVGPGSLFYAYGPLDLVSSSLLRSMIRQLEAVLQLALIAMQTLSTRENNLVRSRLNMRTWAVTHDLKNAMASVSRLTYDLERKVPKLDHNSLKCEVEKFCENFSTVLKDWVNEIDRALRDPDYRKYEDCEVRTLLEATHARAFQKIFPLQPVHGFEYTGPRSVVIKTFRDEFEVVLEELFTNCLKHIREVRNHPEKVFVDTHLTHNDSSIEIRIGDEVPKADSYKEVSNALEDPKKTLGGFVRTLIEKQLDGHLLVEHGIDRDTVTMIVRMDKQTKLK